MSLEQLLNDVPFQYFLVATGVAIVLGVVWKISQRPKGLRGRK